MVRKGSLLYFPSFKGTWKKNCALKSLKYGLNTGFLTYNGCVQAVNTCINNFDIDVQSSKFANLRIPSQYFAKFTKDQ